MSAFPKSDAEQSVRRQPDEPDASATDRMTMRAFPKLGVEQSVRRQPDEPEASATDRMTKRVFRIVDEGNRSVAHASGS